MYGYGTDKVYLFPKCNIYTGIQKKNCSELMLLSGSTKCVDLPLNLETYIYYYQWY